ncbi:MAG: elongation factor P [Dehalococcoidales bacterium]|jgi:elongation factor P|nr:elongation factor P [Dehalococcoidales bacterium]
MDIADIHKNVKLLVDGIPYNVDDLEFTKPGKGRAIYRLKLRNLIDGNINDRTFHSGEKVDEAQTTYQQEQYLYRENDHYIFMNTETFEQLFVTEAQIGSKKDFLKEGILVDMLMFGDRPIDITLPNFIEFKVLESEISIKSQTISPQLKAATIETGAVIGVPSFIKEGDLIKVDTRSGTYIERINKK